MPGVILFQRANPGKYIQEEFTGNQSALIRSILGNLLALSVIQRTFGQIAYLMAYIAFS